MNYEPCTFSQESAADCLPTSSSDISQLSLLSGIHMPAKSCDNEPPKDGSPVCQCGKGTLDCSIHPSTPESWTAFMRDSLARTLALLESRQAYLREPDQVFTAKSCASLAWFDRDSCSWRTYQQSFLTDSEPYLETWPRWGMCLDGVAYARPMSERRIAETDGFYWPTPVQSMHKGSSPASLTRKSGRDRSNDRLDHAVMASNGGQLNPDWVGWLMGFPIGWANSKATATPKSHCKPQQHGDYSEAQHDGL